LAQRVHRAFKELLDLLVLPAILAQLERLVQQDHKASKAFKALPDLQVQQALLERQAQQFTLLLV
jgi:uncharacterized protein involved in exopolysaccharide biosynthesis